MEKISYQTFRYTFNSRLMPEGEDIMAFIITLINEVFQFTEDSEWTMGFHTHDACGDSTHPHFHLHYRAEKSLDAYRKAFQRWNIKQGDYRKGNELYSLKNSKEEHIRDINAFFRYPFKMVHLDQWYFNQYFTEDNLQYQIDLAVLQYEERKTKELERKRKLMDKTTTYDKFIKYLGEKELKKKIQVQLELIEFYKKEKMSMNPKTMQGYTYTYMMHTGLMSPEQFITLMDKN